MPNSMDLAGNPHKVYTVEYIHGVTVQTAKLFQNGKSQAVRLPKEFRFQGSEVYVKKTHNAVILIPKDNPWESLLRGLEGFSDDFMSERNQPRDQEREDL